MRLHFCDLLTHRCDATELNVNLFLDCWDSFVPRSYNLTIVLDVKGLEANNIAPAHEHGIRNENGDEEKDIGTTRKQVCQAHGFHKWELRVREKIGGTPPLSPHGLTCAYFPRAHLLAGITVIVTAK